MNPIQVAPEIPNSSARDSGEAPPAPSQAAPMISSLEKKPGERRHAGDGQRRDPHGDEGDRQVLPQPAHVAHVLRVGRVVRVVQRRVHGVDHRAGAQEEAGLEEGVRHQVEDAGHVRAHPHRREHEAELRHGGVRQHLFDVPLLQADGGREDRRQRADQRRPPATPWAPA
jgi:hypothetical protein